MLTVPPTTKLWFAPAVDLRLGFDELPSAGVTRLRRYYEPIRHLPRPPLALTGSALPHGTGADFPCCIWNRSRACRHHYPGETGGQGQRILNR